MQYKTENLNEGPVTHHFHDGIITPAKECLVKYFKMFGAVKPGDMEDYFCGEPSLTELITESLGRFKQSIFYPALAHLIEENIVTYWSDENADLWYGLNLNKIKKRD